MNNLLFLVDKGSTISISDSALYSILSIVMVFAILLIIIGITELIFKINGLFSLKKDLEEKEKRLNGVQTKEVENNNIKPLVIDENDEDLMAAILVATIDYQEEIKKDVRVVNVKRIN